VAEPTDASDATFAREVAGPLPVLVDFLAPWCGPCRMVAPVLEQLADELAGRLRAVRLNVDENPRTAGAYGVHGIPTLYPFKDGAPVARAVGYVPKEHPAPALEPFLAPAVGT
jgi:thioredoxin